MVAVAEIEVVVETISLVLVALAFLTAVVADLDAFFDTGEVSLLDDDDDGDGDDDDDLVVSMFLFLFWLLLPSTSTVRASSSLLRSLTAMICACNVMMYR